MKLFPWALGLLLCAQAALLGWGVGYSTGKAEGRLLGERKGRTLCELEHDAQDVR